MEIGVDEADGIVEFVRNARNELSECGQFFTLNKLLLCVTHFLNQPFEFTVFDFQFHKIFPARNGLGRLVRPALRI